MLSPKVEAIKTYKAIINLLSSSVSELFRLLMRHITAEEADGLAVVEKINEAAKLRADLEREGWL